MTEVAGTERKFDSRGRDITPTWVINPHGVKSCTHAYIAEMFMTKRPGWKYAEPDFVPEEKVYPTKGEFTKNGLERRLAIINKEFEILKSQEVRGEVSEPVAKLEPEPEQKSEPKIEDMTYRQKQIMAAKLGIKSVGIKEDELTKQLKEFNN